MGVESRIALRRGLQGLLAGALLGGPGFWAGCQQADPPEDWPPEQSDEADDLYSLRQISFFEIELDDAAWAALEEEPKEYVRGSFRYDGVTYDNVGIRLKGNFTLTELDEKPSFKVKFNKYEKGRRFLGLEGLTLNNMHSDPTMMREHLAYLLFRELGVPSPRTGYASLLVNDKPYGLYLNLESLDDEFLDRNYEDPSGNLYEGEHGSDVDHKIEAFEQDEGEDESRQDLDALAAQADADDGAFLDPSRSLLDVERVLDFLVGEVLTGHFDGYWSSHNYFVYHEPEPDQWTWIPWSTDQTFVRHERPFDGEGYLFRACFADKACTEAFVTRGLRGIELMHELELGAEIERVLELIDDAARADKRKRFSNATMESNQAKLRDWIPTRLDSLAAPFDCLVDGEEPDADSDGFGACVDDCDDHDPDVHVEAEEICDELDNDCSGYVDDHPDCPCPSREIEGREYHACDFRMDWRDAQDYCEAKGLVLARIDSAGQNEALVAFLEETSGEKKGWAIGLNDSEEENVYRWQNGDLADYTNWADGQPAHTLEWFDCVFLDNAGDGEWREKNCIESASFVCSPAG